MVANQQQRARSRGVKGLAQPIVLRPNDFSGTPIALIESARRRGTLEIRERVQPTEILIEFPFGDVPREQTGCSRFVRLRSGNYSLIR